MAPCADAVWVGECGPAGADEAYHPTRRAGFADVRARLVAHVEAGRRVLVGFDFPYGYPRGLASALALGGARPPWRGVWDIVGDLFTDSAGNVSNRFQVAHALNHLVGEGPGPFWGCPPGAETARLTARRDGAFGFPYPFRGGALARLRTTEAGMAVQEAWKLMGAGSVGSQALTGIPYVRALRDDPALASVSRVWPFESGFGDDPRPGDGPCVVHAEIWPGVIPADMLAAETTAGAIRDQAQVRLLARLLHDRDAAGALAPSFARPPDVSDEDAAAAVAEEGWILAPLPVPGM